MTEIVSFKPKAQKEAEEVKDLLGRAKANIDKVFEEGKAKLVIFLYAEEEVGANGCIIGGAYNPEKLALLINNAQELKYFAWDGTDEDVEEI